MLSGGEEVLGDVRLGGEVGGEADGLDLGVLSELAVAGIELAKAPATLDLLGELGAELGEGDELEVGEGGEVGDMDALSHEAAADIGELERWHVLSSGTGR